MLRALVSLLCIVSLIGCSSQSNLSSAYDARLNVARQYADGTVHLVDEHNDTVYLRADDKLVVTMADGQVVSMRGSQVCRTSEGLLMRSSSDSCAEATWVGAWGDVSSVSVEQFDGAATVAITATVAVVVAGIILVAIASKGSGNSSNSSGSSGGRTLASPGRGGGSSGGGGHVGPGPVGGGSVGGSSAPHHSGGGGYRGGYRGGSSGGVVLNVGIGNNTYGGGSYYGGGEVPPMGAPVGNGPSPLFSNQSVRRATVRPSLRFDFTGCISSFRCTAESLKLGVLLADFVELSGGARIEQQGSQTALLALAGIGLQGRFPGVPSMALFLGSQFAFGPLVRVAPQVGLRFRPTGDLWIGLNPIAMTYFADEHKAVYTPSVDLAYEF